MTPAFAAPRALLVTSYDPTDAGGAPLVTLGLLQSLQRLGYDVGVLQDGPSRKNADASLFRRVPRPEAKSGAARLGWNLRRLLTSGELPRWNATTWSAIRDELARSSPELVVLDNARMAEYGLLLRRHGYSGRIVLNEHNVEYDLLARQQAHEARLGKRLELAFRINRMRRVEANLARYADACLALSTVDRDHLLRLNPGLTCAFVPPAIDLERYRTESPLGHAPELLFIGSCHWAPNLDGLQWFVHEIWPLIRAEVPEARLTVVGRGPPAWLAEVPGATAEGFVPDERPYFTRARAVIAPLRFGSGVRIKILNALAMSRPVVSTTLGAEGIPVAPGESIELADAPAEFARHSVRLLRDEPYASRMGAAGHAVALSRYAPAVVDQVLSEVLRPPQRLAS